MIYVTVGGFVGGFERLIRAIDSIAPSLSEPVVAQTGKLSYTPRHITAMEYVNYRDTQENIRKARLVVAHAGGGTMIFARKYGVPLIIVPRRKKYNEHYNDHQVELCRMVVEERKPGVYVVEDPADLKSMIEKVLAMSNAGAIAADGVPPKTGIIAEIRAFIS